MTHIQTYCTMCDDNYDKETHQKLKHLPTQTTECKKQKKNRQKVIKSTMISVSQNESGDKSSCKPFFTNGSFQFAKSALDECKIILSMVFPIAIASTVRMLPQAISFSFVGHLSDSTQLLAGTGLARIYTNVTATSFALGMTTGLQTLIAQAIGNKNELQKPYLIALYIQQCICVSFIVLVPLTILQFYSGSIMRFIGQPPDLCIIVNNYCRSLIPYLWLTNILMIFNRVGNALHFSSEIMIIYLIGALTNLLCNYLFIDYLQYSSYLFTAISLDISQLICAFSIICLLCYKGHYYIFKPLALRQILRWRDGIWTYLKLTFPALIQIASCWWITELIVLFTGFITTETSIALSAVSIATMINSFMKSITIGVSTPITIRVGKYIGAGSIHYAKQAAKIGFLYIDIFVLVIMMAFIYFMKRIFPLIWTEQKDVIDLVSKMLCAVAIFQIPFNIFFYIGSIYRGLGLQRIVAFILFVFQYLIGIPLNLTFLFYFGFRKDLIMGSLGIWCMIIFAYSLATVTLIIHFFCFVDWRKALKTSQSRIDKTMLIKKYSDNKNYGTTTASTILKILDS